MLNTHLGTFFGVYAVYGLLTGSLLSSVQLAISMSNTGGAWDNCKKYLSAKEVGKEFTDERIKEWRFINDKWEWTNVTGMIGGKHSDMHKASGIDISPLMQILNTKKKQKNK